MTDGDPGTDGVLDLLGLLAYAELVAFFRLAEDAAMAPSLADKAELGRMAVAEFSHFERIRAELERCGTSAEAAMEPFRVPLDAFHQRTAPADWLEGLVKAYVGDGFATDFYRAAAAVLDPGPRALVLGVLADTGHARFAVERVRAAIEADPRVAGRLALWARRLVGEALSEAQRVAAERPALARLLVPSQGSRPDGEQMVPSRGSRPDGEQMVPSRGSRPDGEQIAGSSQLGEIGRMFARLTDAHAQRMSSLGLAG